MKLLSIVGALLVAAPAWAEVIALKADLSPQNEVPPANSQAKGGAKIDYDTASRTIYWNIEYEGLSAPLSAAHFHGPAPSTANAGVLVPIVLKTQASPLVGSVVLTEAQASEMLAGRWYVNMHTPNNPGGELRGQVVRR